MSTDLENAQITAQARLRVITGSAVTAAWRSLPHYDEANVADWLKVVLPLILAAQRQSVALTRAYLTRALDGHAVNVDVAELVGAAVRNGTPPAEVYRRPFVTVWTELQQGTPWQQAVEHGLERATSTAAMDVQLSQTHTAAAVGRADQRITGWERVPDAGACDLCLIASTQRYHKADLMPIHNHCGCGVRPIVGGDDRQVVNPELLAELKKAGALRRITAQRQAAAAREASGIDVAVHEHGELGPVLTNAADNFTSEHELHH